MHIGKLYHHYMKVHFKQASSLYTTPSCAILTYQITAQLSLVTGHTKALQETYNSSFPSIH